MRTTHALLGVALLAIAILAACLYETDRREKRTAATMRTSLAAIYTFLGDPVLGYADVGERKPLPCTQDGTTTLLVIGQSNAANMGDGRYLPRHHVDNYDYVDGQCYPARDPLLGPTGSGANFATQLGDLLIERGLSRRVLLLALAVGNTSIEDWQPGTPIHRRMGLAITRLALLGIIPDQVLWAQGEGNNPISAEDIEAYRDHLLTLVSSIRHLGITGPFLAAKSTVCDGAPHDKVWTAIQEAVQTGALSLGPDTDVLGADYRRDRCHFNERGVQMQAKLWADSIEHHGE